MRSWLPILLALAVAPSARAASFTETQTLADWGSSNGSPAAAPGYLGWTSADAVHIGDATIPAVGAGLKIAPGATAAWTGSDGPHLWHGADSVPAGALTNLRGLAVAPNDAAWIGVAGGGSKQVQVSHFDGSAWTAAKTLPELNPSNYAMAGAGDGGHVLFAWHSAGGDPNRIIYSADGADPQFLTPAGEWNANPSVAVAPNGNAVIAWARGNGDTTIIARMRAADGTWGPETPLGDGNLPSAAMTADGAAVVAWRGADLAVYVSRNLAAPERIVGDTPGSVVASTAGNDTIVAWTALPPNGDFNTDGRVEATAAAPAEHFGAPVILADGYARESLAAGGDAVIWSEVRNTDSRIRAAHLQQAQAPPAGGDPGAGTVSAPPPIADRTKPRLKIRHLSRHRLAIRANETVTIRVAKRRFTVHANRQRIVTFGKGRFTLKATDRAGNTRTVTVRIR